MGIDSMRVGGGRCPPLLVGGLLVTCLMLICNWWTLSSENIELVRQIDELNEQLKISAEERDQCVTLRGNLEKSFKNAEKEMESLHVRLEQQTDLKKKNDDMEESLQTCKTDLDNLRKVDDTKSETLETLKLEKENSNAQLEEKREENRKLQEEVDQLKDELNKIKLTYNKLDKTPELTQQSTRTANNKTQLGSVPESAVKVSVAGQRGLKYHGIPILPRDPPGAVRLSPRLSVTMLKAKASPVQANKGTVDQNTPDTTEVEDEENSKQGNLGSTDGNIVESERDAQMIAPASNK
ncbi:uncharacterized protein LOC144476466 isoform X1 [Augochlora pura]